jgi:hypothetical protein
VRTRNRTGLPAGEGPRTTCRVSGVKPIDDAAARRIRRRVLAADGPVAGTEAFAAAPTPTRRLAGRTSIRFHGAPYRMVVVDRHRIGDAEIVHGSADILHVPVERKLGCVDTEDDHPRVSAFVRPSPDVGQRAYTVDAGVGLETHQYDLAAQALGPPGRKVQPRVAPERDGSAPPIGGEPLDGAIGVAALAGWRRFSGACSMFAVPADESAHAVTLAPNQRRHVTSDLDARAPSRRSLRCARNDIPARRRRLRLPGSR